MRDWSGSTSTQTYLLRGYPRNAFSYGKAAVRRQRTCRLARQPTIVYAKPHANDRLKGMPMPHVKPTSLFAALVIMATLPVVAQEPPRGGTRVSPGGTTRVYVMAAFDKDCVSLPKPEIAITTLPGKGQVSLREGQTVVVQQSLSGSCLGQRVTGTGVYYTAGVAAEGPDSFTITARLSTGEVTQRTFQLRIED